MVMGYLTTHCSRLDVTNRHTYLMSVGVGTLEYKMDLKLFYLGCVGATVQTAYYSYTDSIIAKMQLNEIFVVCATVFSSLVCLLRKTFGLQLANVAHRLIQLHFCNNAVSIAVRCCLYCSTYTSKIKQFQIHLVF